MHRRATSKKRVVEAEQEIDMEDKEATPVEDVELTLPPAEPTQKEDTKMERIMELFQLMMKEMDSTDKEELRNQLEKVNKKLL